MMEWQELISSQRLKEMISAINHLKRWQESTYQLPTLENAAAFYEEKERISALLVDNHLGKLARKVRIMGNESGLDSLAFIDAWAEIAFFTLLWSEFEKLPHGLKLNLIYQSGVNITRKHLSQEEPFHDQFLVVGQDSGVEEQLLRRSVYFYGRNTECFYVLLEYSFNQRPFEIVYSAGDVYEGSVVRYPFPGSLRISPESWNKVHGDGIPFDGMQSLDMKKVIENFSDLLKVNPFYESFPVMIQIISFREDNEWLVYDVEGHRIRMAVMEEDKAAIFYATTYRRQVLMFALCTRKGLFPLSYFNGEYLVELG